jgi:outer membrane protein TolC
MPLALWVLFSPVVATADQVQPTLSISKVLEVIGAQSPQILAAQAESQQAKARVGQARAAWFGTVDTYALSQHYNDPRLTRPITYPPDVANYPFARDQLGYGVKVNLPLDLSLKIAAEVDAARADAQAARWSADDARLHALLIGATLYRDLQAQGGRSAALDSQLTALTASVDVAKAGVRAGTLSELKRLRLEAALAEVRATRASVEGNIRTLRAQLAALMGETLIDGAIAPLTAPPAALPTNLSLPVPGVQAAQSALDASQNKLAAAKRSLLPHFFIDGSWDQNAIQGFHDPEHTWQINLGMKVNLWSGGAQISAIDAAQSAGIASRQKLRSAQLAMAAAREAALAQWQSEQQAYAAAQAGLDAALQSARIERENFRVGLSSATDLLDAEATLAQTQANLADTLARWWQADATLRYAYGEPPLAMTDIAPVQEPLTGITEP